jgi:hypothetical protein
MRKFLSLVVAVGLVLAISADSVEVSAQAEAPIQFDGIYYPWVPHGDVIDGTGPWYGSITVQNVDVEGDNLGVRIWVFDARTMNQVALNDDGTGDDYTFEDALEDSRVPRYDLDPNASITLSSGELGIEEPGSALAVYAVYKQAWDLRLDHPAEAFDIGAPTIAGIQKQALGTPMMNARTTDAHLTVDGYTAIPFADVPWGSQSEFCYEIAGGIDSCDGTGFHTLPGGPASGFDGHSYLPIVQTNAGWNTEIYLSNVDFSQVTAAQVNITLIASHQQGSTSPAQHKFTETFNIPAGGTTVLNVADYTSDGWVGSAHIEAEVGIVAIAVRQNAGEQTGEEQGAGNSEGETDGDDQ